MTARAPGRAAHTCDDLEGGGLASAIHAQQAKAVALGDARPQAPDCLHGCLQRPLPIRLFQAVYQHL